GASSTSSGWKQPSPHRRPTATSAATGLPRPGCWHGCASTSPLTTRRSTRCWDGTSTGPGEPPRPTASHRAGAPALEPEASLRKGGAEIGGGGERRHSAQVHDLHRVLRDEHHRGGERDALDAERLVQRHVEDDGHHRARGEDPGVRPLVT